MDGIWATAAGLGVGALLGLAIGRLVLYLRREHKEAVGLDDFLAMGLIALSYGAALLLHAYGFLAVFAAGVALRHLEQSQSAGPDSQQAVEQRQRRTRTSRWPKPSPWTRAMRRRSWRRRCWVSTSRSSASANWPSSSPSARCCGRCNGTSARVVVRAAVAAG